MSSQQKIEANRQNAQKSSGPTSPAGKEKSSLNAVKHGWTGQTIVVTPNETEPYQNITAGILKDLAPVGVRESDLAHGIANNRWRLHQLAATEAGLYAIGYIEHKTDFDGNPLAEAMVRALVFQEKRKDFDRLRRYESGIHRQITRDMAELIALQTARKAQAAQQLKDAIALHTYFTAEGKTWNPADFGFVLSIEEIERIEQREFLRNRVCKA
jgi:hypothetical protein